MRAGLAEDMLPLSARGTLDGRMEGVALKGMGEAVGGAIDTEPSATGMLEPGDEDTDEEDERGEGSLLVDAAILRREVC